jgi:hypothetical protein
LLDNPLHRRVVRHIAVQNFPAPVLDQKKQ